MMFGEDPFSQCANVDEKGSAAQLVPKITPITKSTTQFMRSAQWIIPRPSPPLLDDNTAFARYRRYFLAWIPGLNLSLRLFVFMVNEATFLMFRTTRSGNYLRAAEEKELLEYMRAGCPEKYYDIVLPKYPLGCKVGLSVIGLLELFANR